MSQPNSADDLSLEDESFVAVNPAVEQPAAAVGPTAAPRPVPTQKQKTNVYTVMLIISFICLCTACLLLWIELSRWGSFPTWWNTSDAKPNVSQWVPPTERLDARDVYV